jgi:hypothetical protein
MPERSLWEEWFGADIVTDLALGAKEQRDSVATDVEMKVCERFEPLIRASMERPLVMMHWCNQVSNCYKWHNWTLVLPNGAIAHLYLNKRNTARLRTCFFSDQIVRKRPVERSNIVSENLVKRFGKLDASGFWTLPVPSHNVQIRDTKTGNKYDHNQIRFITPQQWGFTHGNYGAVWLSRNLAPWPNQTTMTTSLHENNCHKLPHRRRIEEESNSHE